MALYAFKAYFNRSWLFGFRFHLCHWKRWKGQLCDLSSLKVTPQADWLCQCYVSGLSAADGLQVPLGQGHKRPAARKVIRWRCQIGHSTAQRPKSQWLARWSISWIELSYVHIHIHIYILYILYIYIYYIVYIYTYILYYYIIYIYICSRSIFMQQAGRSRTLQCAGRKKNICSRSIFRQYSLLEGGNPTHLHETSRLWAYSRETQKLYRMMLHIGRRFQPLSNMPSPPEGSEEIEGAASRWF